jgi:hypothetical protein
MVKKIIDIVSNGTTTPQGIDFENNADDATYGSPVRALQVEGRPLTKSNPIPIYVAPTSFYRNYATPTRVGAVILKSSAGRVRSIDSDGTTLTGAIYLQLFDAIALPTDVNGGTPGTRCLRYFPVLPGTVLVFNDMAMDFLNGIVVAVSSTRETYTSVADITNVYFNVSYR